MTVNLILFFLAGPIILAIGNFILGPIFNKKIPFSIQVRSFIVSTIIYLICAGLLYHFFLSSKF